VLIGRVLRLEALLMRIYLRPWWGTVSRL